MSAHCVYGGVRMVGACVRVADSSNPLEEPCDEEHEEIMKTDPSKVLLHDRAHLQTACSSRVLNPLSCGLPSGWFKGVFRGRHTLEPQLQTRHRLAGSCCVQRS